MTSIKSDSRLEILKAAVFNIPAPVAVLMGSEHRHELVNEQYKQVSGGGRDVTGLTAREAFPELEGQALFGIIDRVYQTGEPWTGLEYPIRYNRHGIGLQDTWFNLSFVPLRDASGQIIGILSFAVEVTDQVRARHEVEHLLAESENVRNELVLANEQLQDQQVELELANQHLQENAVELEAQTEELQATAAQLEEMTEHALAAREISAARETEIRTLADAIPTLAWTARADGFIDWYNARWYEYTGTTPKQMEGWGWQSVHDPDQLQVVLGRWREAVATGDVFEMTFPLRRSDGEFRRFLTRVTPLRDPEGRVVRWFGTNTDVEAERTAREAAESANQAKTDFLANMSHELRTPLNAIAGYTELLELGLHGPISDEQRETLSRIQRSQRHLLGLINEVLNFAKLETGAVHYDIESVPLTDALGRAASLLIPQARAKRISLEINHSAEQVTALADDEKLQQILINLVSNAVKFTESGGRISISASGDESFVSVRISDTGIGIPADKLESIFDPFVQVRSNLTRQHDGTGLGLAISRDLARGMNGDLTATSISGAGSTFILRLPAHQGG